MVRPTTEESAGYDEPGTQAPGVVPSAKRRGFPLSDTLFLILLLAVGSNGLLLANSSEELDRGRAIYREHCMDCHGETGKGDGVKAPFLSPRPGNLISASTSAKTDKELLRTIAQGKPRTAMPAWQDRLPAADQQSVLSYIRSLIRFTRSLTPPPPTP